ncbi:hypothetical protein HMPREF9148_00637 [Prevotella sp. F0091]|nr:hypothetical protein HMPREF9148_00637 [Prevotella sp. F0091]
MVAFFVVKQPLTKQIKSNYRLILKLIALKLCKGSTINKEKQC